MDNNIKQAMDTIFLLTQKKNYDTFSTKDIEVSILEAIEIINSHSKNRDIRINNPTHLVGMDRKDMVECSIMMWKQIGDAVIKSLKE